MENRLKKLLELRKNFIRYYFTPDARKQGGHYEKKTEYVKRIDPVKEYIIMKDDTIIRFHYIKELQGEIFNKVIVG